MKMSTGGDTKGRGEGEGEGEGEGTALLVDDATLPLHVAQPEVVLRHPVCLCRPLPANRHRSVKRTPVQRRCCA